MSSLEAEIAFREPEWALPSHLLGIRIRQGAPLDLLIDGLKIGDWKRSALHEGDASVEVVAAFGPLEVHTEWKRLGPGLLSRRDSLISHASEPLQIRRCHSALHLHGEDWRMQWQSSAWSQENQPEEAVLRGATLKLQHRPGRTSEQSNPFAVFVNPLGIKLSMHVLPESNWTIRAIPVATGIEPSRISISAGPEDEGCCWTLNPGETFSLPEILYGKDEPEILHAAMRDRYPIRGLPVMYNTWFQCFDNIDVDELHKQLATAVQIGCEMFVVDAGWFGQGENWWEQVGYWHEQTDRAFKGRMKDFADAVRTADLDFGLWMEPDRFQRDVEVRKAHPEWFPHHEEMFSRIDLTRPDAYQWLSGEMRRLVDTYGLKWMKIDFNFELGEDASGHALIDYFRAWYRLLAELQKTYPNTVFEACSSGAMRLDLKVLGQLPLGFLSDTVNPWECLSIAQGAWRRLPPGRLGRWAVLRNRGGETQTCSGAGWELAQRCSPEFSAAAAFLGALGFSGDIASLPPEEVASLAKIVAAFKERRGRICQAQGTLLTPQKRADNREGWTAMQLHLAGWNLVGVYRMVHAAQEFVVRPASIDREKSYRIRDLLSPFRESMPGGRLLDEGVTVKLANANSAALLEIVEA